MEPKIVLNILPSPFLHDQKRNAPLGVMYIAAVLEREGYDVSIADLRGLEETAWLAEIPEADIYGISASSLEYYLAVKLAHKLKRERRGFTVLGGVHVTVTDPAGLDPVFDAVVLGEGDLAMLELVADYKNGKTKRVYRSEFISDLDSLPLPARHLLPHDSLISTELVEREETAPGTTIITSRGCPWDCAFCANRRLWGRKVRFHSVDRVVAEIKSVIEIYGVRHFRFHDDTITMNKRRLREMSRALAPLKIRWRCNGRADETDEETIKLLRESGCDEIGFGIETASQTALDLCHKKTTVEQGIRAIKLAKEGGLKAKAFFVLGLPGDFGDMSGRIIDFLKAAQPDGANLSTLSPFPGCELYENPDKFGLKFKTRDISKYRMIYGLDNNEYEEDFVFEYDEMSNEQLKYHRKKLLDFVKGHEMDLNR